MLLAIDAGNTHISIGIFDEEILIARWKFATSIFKSGDDIFGAIESRLRGTGAEPGCCVIASVVPRLYESLIEASEALCGGRAPIMVSEKLKTGLEIMYDLESHLGADRIASAAACRRLYPGDNIIVVDAGTALTFGYVSGNGVFEGGIIAPGMGLAARALIDRTSLPNIVIKAPPRVLNVETEASMQSGIVYGYGELVDGMVERIRNEKDESSIVVATGGWSEILNSVSSAVDSLEPELVLKGLKVIHDLNEE